MRLDKTIAACAFYLCVFFCFRAAFAELSEPVSPSAPDVSVREGGNVFIKAEISLYGGERLAGTIIANRDTVAFRSISDRSVAPRVERISDISEISFLEWQGEKKQGGAWFFTPSLVGVLMKGGSEYRCASLPGFDRFTFVSEGRNSWRYACFYGHMKGREWENGLVVSAQGRTTTPVTGTVVKIVFRAGDENSFRGLLRLLQK
ncbi:MAG TPA: hypothetical protein P5295_07190 [Spirochaetota bacterium]|nr:hypothetical protein [Spirochaetota bacterium]